MLVLGVMASILTSSTGSWAKAVSVSRTKWARSAPASVPLEVRRFMQGCGIDCGDRGGYDYTVARFVFMFQDCLMAKGVDATNHVFDYGDRPLTVDGFAGPKTLRAMRRSAALGYVAAPNLKWAEIRVHDPGGRRPTFLNPGYSYDTPNGQIVFGVTCDGRRPASDPVVVPFPKMEHGRWRRPTFPTFAGCRP